MSVPPLRGKRGRERHVGERVIREAAERFERAADASLGAVYDVQPAPAILIEAQAKGTE